MSSGTPPPSCPAEGGPRIPAPRLIPLLEQAETRLKIALRYSTNCTRARGCWWMFEGGRGRGAISGGLLPPKVRRVTRNKQENVAMYQDGRRRIPGRDTSGVETRWAREIARARSLAENSDVANVSRIGLRRAI